MSEFDLTDDLNPYAPPLSKPTIEYVGPGKSQGIDLTRENPFLTVWTRPRATIRGILDVNPTHHVTLLTVVGGICQTIDRASQRNAGDTMSTEAILAMAFITGPFMGALGLYIGAALIGWMGRNLGGVGTSEELRTALAWSQVPILAAIPVTILQFMLLGHELFTSEMPSLENNPGRSMAVVAMGAVELVLGIWSVVILVKGVGEAHRFSSWRALGTMLLLGLLVILPLVLLALFVSMNRH